LIVCCIGLLPGIIQSWIQTTFPEWFLPNRVVLKEQKEGEGEMIMAELFDTEFKAYDRLKPLQGVVIPTCFGLLYYNGTRALIVDYLEGVSLSSPEGATLRVEELSTLLQPCYRALHAFGVHHDDPNLSNLLLAGDGKILVLDLESAVFDLSADDQAFFLKTSVEHLAGRYRSMQAYYRNNGSLEAA
jgi:RIO-like serine/threonine protein kinase